MKKQDRELEFHDSPEWADVVSQLGKEDWWHRVSGRGLPYPILIRLGRSPVGRLVCTGLIAGGLGEVEVSATSLRALPLGEILEDLAAFDKIKDPALRFLFAPRGVQPVRQMISRGPRGLPASHFEAVAASYREAELRSPRAPVKWMAEVWSTPEGKPTPLPTVRRWLQRCRDMKLLGPSTPGKAGEQPSKVGRKR